MATVPLSVQVKQILGAAVIEVLTGNLTDDTIHAVDGIHKNEVPANLVDVLHAIQTMSLSPIVRESASHNVLGELSAAKDKTLPASAPDETQSWAENGQTLRAEIWRNLVLPDCASDVHNQTFDVYAIYDPRFEIPWLLATPVVLQPISVRNMYKDRWPVEQIPLSATPYRAEMIGSHRQFVHADETIQRLPELALLAGSILSFLAATLPATPTGFWDRKPKRTPGRFRRTLAGRPFPKVTNLSPRLRKKNSVTAHLPKGHLARMAKIVSATTALAPF